MNIPSKKSKRTPVNLMGNTEEKLADATRSHLLGMEADALERLIVRFENSKIIKSDFNPRRITLSKAGVTPDAIAEYTIKAGESEEDWNKRTDAFLSTLTESSAKVWVELFGLAASILAEGLLQPIVVNTDHVIIAGERRWTASQLAGQTYSRVIVRKFTSEQETVFRLIENLSRTDLTVAETVSGLRSVISDRFGECAHDNKAISVNAISKLMGVGRTNAAYYRALCRLPEGNPILDNIYDDLYTSLKSAYEDASECVRQLNRGQQDKAPEQSPVDAGVGDKADKKADAEIKKPVTKVQIPTPQSVSRLIGVFASIEGITESASAELSDLSLQWSEASDKEKSAILSKALTMALEILESQP